jgi:hypothetical protein
MRSKKLQKRIERVEAMDAQLVQMMLRLERQKASVGVDLRKSRTRRLCQIGGEVEFAGLGDLPENVFLGALLLVFDQMSDKDFRSACRNRAAPVMAQRARTKAAHEVKAASKEKTVGKAKASKNKRDIVPAPQVSVGKVTMPASSKEVDVVVVRFSRSIAFGQRLRALGLAFDGKKKEWRGIVSRAQVEAEIDASQGRHLVVEIQSSGCH